MISYQPGSFADVFNTSLGISLWEFLCQSENLLRMETATYLHRPAAEVIAPSLILAFGKEAFTDRVKQMVGNMVRQIMESLGYVVDRQNVRIPAERQCLFHSLTRYKKREGHAQIRP